MLMSKGIAGRWLLHAGVLLLGLGGLQQVAAAEAEPGDTSASTDDAGSVVVTVGDQAIQLRDLENELLRREGRAFIDVAIGSALDAIDWAALGDDETIVSVRGQQITRLALVVPLLQRQADGVIGELISISMTRQALERHGIALDSAVIEAELERQEGQLRAVLEREGQPAMAFADYIQHSQGMTLGEYASQDGFQMAAGLHELVHRLAEVDEAAVRDHYVAQAARFSQSEGVRLSVIRIPYRLTTIAGQELPDPNHVRALSGTMRQIREDIINPDNPVDFARAWNVWGRGYDQGARPGGDLAWVDRAGRSSLPGVTALPPEVTLAAFAAADGGAGGMPVLLEPITYPDGIALVLVEGYREAARPEYAEIVDAVRRDYIESNLPALTQSVMRRVRRETAIDFAPLPPLIKQRQADLAAMIEARTRAAASE